MSKRELKLSLTQFCLALLASFAALLALLALGVAAYLAAYGLTTSIPFMVLVVVLLLLIMVIVRNESPKEFVDHCIQSWRGKTQ